MGALVDYTKLPEEYVDRYTPEVARREGYDEGQRIAFAHAKYLLATKLTKNQLAERLTHLIENGLHGKK